MFGYVTLSPDGLSKERQDRYRAFYCGLCHSIKERYGSFERITLSYDLCFLAILLQSMYEEKEEAHKGKCLPHPFREHEYISGPVIDYCADMNLLLAFHKARDDRQDDHSPRGHMEEKLLRKSYEQLQKKYPGNCKAVEDILKRFAVLEKQEHPSLDELMNLTGDMLGTIYCYRRDEWTQVIAGIGKGLGRFVYLMDAYEDLPEDIRRKRFNPLKEWSREEGYETLIKQSLTLTIARATESFEVLPLVADVDLLRNILYAGCWSKYQTIIQKRKPHVPAEKTQGGHS